MMEDEERGLLLLELIFGEAAGAAQRGASERLMRWARAFEAWMQARQGRCGRDSVKHSRLAWGRLVRQCGNMPWEMEAEDIEAYTAWMREEGYSPSTVYNALGYILNFFRWCREREIDPECQAGFDPGAGVRRVRTGRYAQARLLSREELEALLEIMRQDPTPVGKRDYAFTLARLEQGASPEEMQVFLDSREDKPTTKYRLGKLPQLPQDDPGREARQGQAPDRRGTLFNEGDGLKHGLYANRQPPGEVAALLAERAVGMDEEVAGLRSLGRRLIERMETAPGRQAAQLGGAYSLLAARLGELMRIKNEIEKKKYGGSDVEDILRKFDEDNIEMGLEPVAEKFRAKVLAEARERGMDCQGLAEEAAALRLVLRRMFELAMGAGEEGEYARLADLYGASCVRLARLLKSVPEEGNLVSEAFWRDVDQALAEVVQEFIGN
jgi:hypothetical protein